MPKKKPTFQRGFTLTELMIATVISSIVILGTGTVLVDNQRGWTRMYERVYSDVVTDSYVARKMFDTVIRKASKEKLLLDAAGEWIEVYYYQDASSTYVDRYARFSYDDGAGQLSIEHGSLNPRETLSTQTVCENVSACVFKAAGQSAQMILTLDNGSQRVVVTSSSVMHNQ